MIKKIARKKFFQKVSRCFCPISTGTYAFLRFCVFRVFSFPPMKKNFGFLACVVRFGASISYL